jgi:tetratricopeptide (TPR) repeat protein
MKKSRITKIIGSADHYMKNRQFNKALELYLNLIDDKGEKTNNQIHRNNQTHNGVVLNNIGICYFELNDFVKAIYYFKKVIEIKEIADVYNNIATCYSGLKYYNKAIENSHKSLQCALNCGAYQILADVAFYNKCYSESIDYYKKALDIANKNNKHLQITYNLAFPYLASKDFKTGLELYETRLSIPNIQGSLVQRLEIPSILNWNGIDETKHLLVVSEQGFGDNIQYFRFVIELSRKFPDMRITYFTRLEIAHLFKKYENINIITSCNDTTIFTHKIYIMSLPYILNLQNVSLCDENYINISDIMIAKWKTKLSSNRLKVGIVWKGLLHSFIDKIIPMKLLEPLLRMDIDIICIQRRSDYIEDINSPEMSEFKKKFICYDIDEDVAFEDTVGILQNIDLLLSVDTITIHLAGVMGIPSILMLGHYSDWRWFNCPEQNSWYKSVKNVKMVGKDNWESVIQQVCTHIKDLIKVYRPIIFDNETSISEDNSNQSDIKCETHTMNKIVPSKPSIPISIGELFDKFSILEIKKQKLSKHSNYDNIIYELDELKPIVNTYSIDDKLYDELKSCNYKLWNIEDDIRVKESTQQFDKEFVELARLVYKTNDERCRIKGKINNLYGSSINEVKCYSEY